MRTEDWREKTLMSTDLLTKWLAHYDPIHRGYTQRGIANGVCATAGWSFPRIKGGCNLYRGTPAPEDIDTSLPVGAAGPTTPTISNFAWRPHTADTEYYYALRATGGGGVESSSSVPAVSVAFGASGTFLGGRPNAPTALAVVPAYGGRFLIRWSYSALGEEAAPETFQLYSDGGTGTIDYENPVAQVAYRPGQTHFRYTTGPQSHGSPHKWSVRARSTLGREDGNQTHVPGTADASGPEPYPYLMGEVIEE